MTGVDDWLDEGKNEQQRAELQAKAIEFAELYLVFEQDPRAMALLEHWDEHYRRKRTPVNAPHTEYAANEAMRAFIEGIHEQIRFAHSRRN